MDEHPNFFNLFTEDKLNPVVFLALPWLDRKLRLLMVYALLGFGFWLVTPQNGGGRFLLPYLPVFAVLAASSLQKVKPLLITGVLIAILSIGYRGAANARIVPYLLGQQTRMEYLCKRLDFSTRVFADCDGWFAKNIKKTDLVLIKGFHNLYYIDFPFVHESWYKGEKVGYILEYDRYGQYVQYDEYARTKVHENPLTGAVVYKIL